MADAEGSTVASAPEPPAVDRRLNTVRALVRDGATGLALKLLDQWIAEAPDRADLHLLKGVAFEQLSRFEEARAEFARGAELSPDSPQPILQALRLAQSQGLAGEELALMRKLIGFEPSNDRVLRRMLHLECQAKDHAAALATSDRILAYAPGDSDIVVRKAWCLYEMGQTAEAEALVEGHMRGPDPAAPCVVAWSEMLGDRQNRNAEAIARLEEIGATSPNLWPVWACLGKLYHKLDRTTEAADAFYRSVKIEPGHAVCWFDIGVVERQRGRHAEAKVAFERCLELDPMNAGALRIAGYDHRYEYGNVSFKRVNRALARLHRYPKRLQVEVHYAAAKALEDVDEYAAAFEHYGRAGELQKEVQPWSEFEMNGVLAIMKQFVRPDELARVRERGTPTRLPIFVFGMPRSGTTLIEQVIASHPQAFGAGELKLGAMVLNGLKLPRLTIETTHVNTPHMQDVSKLTIPERGQRYLSELRALAGGDYARIVDKMPGNYHWVGLLEAILPGSYLIHSRRHPVDICLSQYRIFFPDGVLHTYNLKDLGRAYRQYDNYMKYWCEVLPKGSILHVRYEDMVTDLETQARAMIEFVGLAWDDACLRFYENDRTVRTASVSQVRRPVYASSIGRWRKFEPYLKPLLDELGPLVREYEDELAGLRPSAYA